MNFELKNLLDQIAKASARTKLVALLSLAAVVAALGLGGWISGRPHFVHLYSGLSDLERVAAEKALAGAQVRYRVSDFPGPFVLYVDESQYDEAQIAVALSEALKTAPKGIDSSSGGASTIFLSAGERQQSMQKREWQETEQLLESLEFIADAVVTTSMPDTSPLRAKRPVMVSVALRLKGSPEISAEQASTVAKLVRFRFGVPPENLVITDQSGRTLYDPTRSEDPTHGARELLAQAEEFERELAAKANRHIEASFGARKALVTVTSQWNYDQSTIVDEKIDPETVAVQVDTKETKSPQGSSALPGGAAGVSSSSPADFGNESAAVPSGTNGATASATAPMSSTKDEKTTYEASRSRTQTVRSVPRLERLFVSLVLDESLASKKDEIQKLVEAAVGFDRQRQDVIGVSQTAFATPESAGPSEGAEGAAAAAEEGLSPTLELLLQRGVEIVSALAFLALLITSLKGSKKRAAAETAPLAGGSSNSTVQSGPDGQSISVDPEALARAQIEELVRSDPRRVGEILSRWVDEKSTVKV